MLPPPSNYVRLGGPGLAITHSIKQGMVVSIKMKMGRMGDGVTIRRLYGKVNHGGVIED